MIALQVLFLLDNVWVVTNQKYVSLVHEQLPEIPLNHILSEPCRRNTAPCIAYVSWRIKKENPKANIVVSPGDHIVTTKLFKRVISNCLKFTAETDAVGYFGYRKPTYAQRRVMAIYKLTFQQLQRA